MLQESDAIFKTEMAYISIISPVYRAEHLINEFVSRICAAVTQITDDFEIILIEDGSPDNSWAEIEKACQTNNKVKGVKLSRNFGQHNSISAGMELASGDYICLLDCDLQHNPDYIPQLYQKIQEGYDIVYTKTIQRKHSSLKNLSAVLYYKFFTLIGGKSFDPNIGSYTLLSRKVVNAYNSFNDYRKAFLPALKWAGFEYAVISIKHGTRFQGTSSYTLGKLIKHAINVSVANSDRLLYLSIYMGIFFSFSACIGILFVIYRYYTIGGMEGWSSTIVTIMFFSGLLLIALGIVGVYISKIFEQTKHRPRYLISKKQNFK